MGFRIRPKKSKVPRDFADLHAFCQTAEKLIPKGSVLTLRGPDGDCSVCLIGDRLHCEFQRAGRGVAIGVRQPPTYINIANIMYACRLRFEEQASLAAGQVGRA